MESGVSCISDEQSRWVVTGVCLNKVLTPILRKVVDAELQNWYDDLRKPPVEIDKQVLAKHEKTLPPSKISLQYKNINGNNMHTSTSAYDYAVKDSLSLARLLVQPFMAKFTGFDQTMDLSALLTILCESRPFVKSGAATHAKNVRLRVRNEWAHCNFSKWTNSMFNDAIQDMQLLVRNINLTAAVEKEICDDLQDWENKVSEVFVDGRYLNLIEESLSEFHRCIVTWKLEADTKINEMEDEIKHHVKELSEKIEHLLKREHDYKQKENYSVFSEKKGRNLFALSINQSIKNIQCKYITLYHKMR